MVGLNYYKPSIVRYEVSVKDYSYLWVCQNCIKCILSQEAVYEHLKICNRGSSNKNQYIPTRIVGRYICSSCDEGFTRKSELRKHLHNEKCK